MSCTVPNVSRQSSSARSRDLALSVSKFGLLIGFSVLAAACGGDASGQAAAAAEPAPTATVAPAPTTTPPPTARPTATPFPTPPAAVAFELDPTLLLKLPEGWTPAVTDVGEGGPSSSPPDGGTLGPVDRSGSRWKYTGVLGKLKPKEAVVAAVADAPLAVAGTEPLTGLVGKARPDRPAVIVKIDNVPAARPQVGLNEADIVYEELVEAGVTRLAAVFHSQSLGTIGPVRSGRSTDIGIIDSYNKPVFAFSGANSIYDRLIDKQPIVNRSAELFTGYWRGSGRPAPHNLFTSSDSLLNSTSGGSAPSPQFAYRASGAELHPTAEPAETVHLTYLAGSSAAIRYEWSASVGGWQRWQAGTRHNDASGVQVAP